MMTRLDAQCLDESLSVGDASRAVLRRLLLLMPIGLLVALFLTRGLIVGRGPARLRVVRLGGSLGLQGLEECC